MMAKNVKDELESFLSNDNLHDFLLIIKRYPVATDEVNRELIAEVRMGNQEKREEMINRNLRLVVSHVFKTKKDIDSQQKIDLIQEGILGLMNAIESYDPEKGSFSTYATKAIDSYIKRYLGYDTTIRRPESFNTQKRKYNRLINDYLSKCEPIPADSEICDILDITKETLVQIREDNKLNTQSLETPLKDGEESTIGDFIPSTEEGYSSTLNDMVDEEVKGILKIVLKPFDYYIMYRRILSESSFTLEEVGNEFEITREAIRSKEERILRRLRNFFDRDRNLSTSFKKVSYGKDIENFVVEPLSPRKIVEYLFVRDLLTDDERQDLKKMFFSDYKKDKNINPTLLSRVDDIVEKNRELFAQFYHSIISDFKTSIFDVDLEMDLTPYKKDEKYTYLLWKDKSYEDFLRETNSKNGEINRHLESKIKAFFNVRENPNIKRYQCEQKLNFLIFGINRSEEIPKEKRFKAFIENIEQFSYEQQTYLYWFFGKITTEEAKERCPKLELFHDKYNLYLKLQMIYFGIKSYRNYDFTKDKYLSIRKKAIWEMDEYYINLLDYFYGLKDGRRKTHEEMATFLGESLLKAKEKIRTAKLQAGSIYLDKNYTISLDLDIYRDYIKSNNIVFSEPTNTIIQMHLFEGKPYKEIEAALGLANIQVSNFITNALWQIDFHRFGIIENETFYVKKDMLHVLNSSFRDESIKEILRLYIETEDANAVAKKYNISSSRVKEYFRKLYRSYKNYQIKNFKIDIEDIKNEINSNPSETVLTEEEKKLVALEYGIKCPYNPFGLKEKSSNKRLLDKALTKIKEKNLCFLRNPLDFIKKEELIDFLKDPHLPIEDYEKELLKDIYGINEPYLTIDEASVKYGMTPRSTLRRIQRATVKIRRYEQGEIKGKIDYDIDIYPYLKFFPKNDQKILIMIYKEKKTTKDLAKELSITISQAINISVKLRMYLMDLKNEKRKGIDFDYFWSHVHDADIPYYGDKQLAISICYDFYEKRMTIPNLVKKYPQFSNSIITRCVLTLPIAVMKRKEGIVRAVDITNEEIERYYNENNRHMSVRHKTFYDYYLNSIKKGITFTKNPFCSELILDILRTRPEYIDLSTVSKETILNIIETYRDKLSPVMIQKLVYLFKLNPRDYMSGSDINQVLGFLSKASVMPQKQFVLKPQQ